MNKFLTTNCKGLKKPVLLWEEQSDGLPKIIGRFASIDDVEDASQYEVWSFPDRLTTTPNTKANQAGQPVVDADGAPLWEGAKISFRVQSHYINTVSGTGVYQSASQLGGSQFVSDEPLNVYDRTGFIVAKRREQYTATSTYVYDRNSELAGTRVLANKIGDPYEHGQTDTFIRLAEDPRGICTLERKAEDVPAASPAP